MDWAIVFKALAPLAGRAVAAATPGPLRSWRVALETKSKAKKLGIRVKYLALRRFIQNRQIFLLFDKPSPEGMDAVAPALRNCIRQHEQRDPETLATLLALMATAYVHSLPPSQASRFEGEATRGHVTSEVSKLHERNSEIRDFEINCARLNPYRAEEARRILPQWSALPRAVTAIVTVDDRTQLFVDWTANKPEWLIGAPASALCWLSSTAQDYGAAHPAKELLVEAIAAGASPHSYWQAKSALMSTLSHDEAEEQLGRARDHPLGASLWANLHGDDDTAIKQILTWEPKSREDQATKKLILSKLLIATNDVDRGIDAAIEGYEENGSSGCALYAAKLLVERGSLRQHPNFMRDLSRGLELAEYARGSRRVWDGDSSEAVLTMMIAYKLLGSPEQTWRTGTETPEGSATTIEANDVRVLTETAMTAAELGKTQLARELLHRIPTGPEKDQVEALITETEFDFETAVPKWIKVLASTSDPEDALTIGLRLAHHGQAIEWPAWITNDYASDASDIDLVSKLFRDVPGTLPQARVRAATSRQVFHGLMSFHVSRKEFSAAALVAETGGGRWNDPEAWLNAAEIHLKGGNQASSVAAAEQAIRVGGPAWLRSRNARIILIEIQSAMGHWDKSLIEATRLLESEPDEYSAKWAFLTCQFMTSDYQGAWDSFVRLGAPNPRTPRDANTWIQLHSRFASDLEYLDEAALLSEQWPENERLRASIVLGMMHSSAKPKTEDQVKQYQKLIASFVEYFPESSLIRSVTVDENNPFESIKAMLPDPVTQDEALQPILKGELPVGMATNLSGKSYAEICLVRGAGKVFAGNPDRLEYEVDIALKSLDERVVIDTTALTTCAVLGADVAREWLGMFSSGVIPTEAIHDAQSSVQSLSTMSTATIGIDKISGGPRIYEISESEAALRLERANNLLSICQELVSVPHPEIAELPRLKSAERDFQWLLSLDLAKSLDLPFWCDDRVLRNLAESVGVQSFGTPALLETIRRNGLVGRGLVEVHEATLIHHYYTGIRFDPAVMELAAEMDSWRPLGTAAAISESGPTTSPQQQISFVLLALRHCLDDPEAVQIWVASIASWLNAVSVDTATAAGNIRFWFSTLLQQEWINASSLPHVLAGLRSAMSEKYDLDTVVPEVLGQLYVDVAKQTNHSVAAGYLRELTRLVPAEDRSGVLQRIIAL